MTKVPRSLRMMTPCLAQKVRECAEGRLPWPLVLLGGVGVGKTCAALCLCDLVDGSRYLTNRELCSLVQMAMAGRLTWYNQGRGGEVHPEQLWMELELQPLVVLDEVGSREKASDHQYECLYQLLERRVYRPLVVISNLTLKSLAGIYDDRVVSRLLPGTIVEVMGHDRREPPLTPGGSAQR